MGCLSGRGDGEAQHDLRAAALPRADLDFAGQASQAEAGMFAVRREPAVFHASLLAAGTAFWQAHLGLDAEAHRWLITDFPGRLRPTDRFEFK